MSECLVTKLKSAVDNSDLTELGVLYYTLDITNNYIELFSSESNTVTVTLLDNDVTITNITGDGTIVNDKTAILPYVDMASIYAGGITVSRTGTINLKIENKYNMGIIDVNQYDNKEWDSLKFYNSIKRVSCGNNSTNDDILDISVLQNHNNIRYISIMNCAKITGDISALNSPSLFMAYISYNSIYGDVSSLKNSINLGPSTQELFHFAGTQITGKMSDLFDGLYANGKTSGNICYVPNNLVENVGEPYSADIYLVNFTSDGWTASTAAT